MPSFFRAISSDLNREQRAAVDATEGPSLIIAGPGTGKTKTLVERVVHLIVDESVSPERILVAASTEKAARELVARISGRAAELGADIDLNEMYIGTLHSIFLRIIEEHRPKTSLGDYRVLDSFEQHYLIHRNLGSFEALEGYGLVAGGGSRWERSQEIAHLATEAAEGELDVDLLLASGSPELAALGRITRRYFELAAQENSLDLSSVQSTLLELLRARPDLLAELRAKILYLMVDDYQDRDAVQEEILLALAAPANNICAIGDDGQSLCRSRGIPGRSIFEFQKNFAPGECRMIELVTNYRSHPGIVDFCNRWMDSMPAKASWIGDGDQGFLHATAMAPREAEFADYTSVLKVEGGGRQDSRNEAVLAFIESLKERGLLQDYDQLAFLFGSARSPRAIALAAFLEERGVSVFSPRSALFFEREEVKLTLGALAFIFPPLVEGHLKRQADAELEVWDYYLECQELFVAELRADPGLHEGLRSWCARKAKAHCDLREDANYGFASLFYELLGFPMFARYVDAGQGSACNMALFSQLIVRFESLHGIVVLRPERLSRDLRSLFNQYLRYLIDGGIAEYEDFASASPPGSVSFMTIGQAKGREFPVVIVDYLDDVPPLGRIERFDFWRLYYTAFSRAQDLLVLTWADPSEARNLARLPSARISPLYDALPDWREAGLESERVVLSCARPPSAKREYSFTQILLYEDCPRQYQFFRELGFCPSRANSMLFGALLRQTVGDLHKALLSSDADPVTEERVRSWLDANYESLSRATRSYLSPAALDAAEDHVMRYLERASADWSSVLEARLRVALFEEEYTLSGSIDLLRGTGGSVEIVDFKAEKKPDAKRREDREKLDRYVRQLNVYARIVEQRYKKRVSRMHLYYTGAKDGAPIASYDLDPAMADRAIDALGEIVKKIEGGNFSVSESGRSGRHCRDCDIKAYCWSKSIGREKGIAAVSSP
jgi:Superfamily I DNA and RNA helicases